MKLVAVATKLVIVPVLYERQPFLQGNIWIGSTLFHRCALAKPITTKLACHEGTAVTLGSYRDILNAAELRKAAQTEQQRSQKRMQYTHPSVA
jgi:hypothetical protein